jgi:hypothetical protein
MILTLQNETGPAAMLCNERLFDDMCMHVCAQNCGMWSVCVEQQMLEECCAFQTLAQFLADSNTAKRQRTAHSPAFPACTARQLSSVTVIITVMITACHSSCMQRKATAMLKPNS